MFLPLKYCVFIRVGNQPLWLLTGSWRLHCIANHSIVSHIITKGALCYSLRVKTRLRYFTFCRSLFLHPMHHLCLFLRIQITSKTLKAPSWALASLDGVFCSSSLLASLGWVSVQWSASLSTPKNKKTHAKDSTDLGSLLLHCSSCLPFFLLSHFDLLWSLLQRRPKKCLVSISGNF